MRKLKASLICLIISMTSACSTLEIAHAPLDCLGMPLDDVRFSQKEANAMSNETAMKIVEIRVIYRKRIKSICKQIEHHNELHSTNK